MRGHLGFRVPVTPPGAYVTQLTTDVLAHKPYEAKARVTQLTTDLLAHKPYTSKARVTQLTVDILVYK